jgi:hypothetical protein
MAFTLPPLLSVRSSVSFEQVLGLWGNSPISEPLESSVFMKKEPGTHFFGDFIFQPVTIQNATTPARASINFF